MVKGQDSGSFPLVSNAPMKEKAIAKMSNDARRRIKE